MRINVRENDAHANSCTQSFECDSKLSWMDVFHFGFNFLFSLRWFSQICQVELFQFIRKVKAKKNLSLSNYLEKLEKSDCFVIATSFAFYSSIPMSLSLKSHCMLTTQCFSIHHWIILEEKFRSEKKLLKQRKCDTKLTSFSLANDWNDSINSHNKSMINGFMSVHPIKWQYKKMVLRLAFKHTKNNSIVVCGNNRWLFKLNKETEECVNWILFRMVWFWPNIQTFRIKGVENIYGVNNCWELQLRQMGIDELLEFTIQNQMQTWSFRVYCSLYSGLPEQPTTKSKRLRKRR